MCKEFFLIVIEIAYYVLHFKLQEYTIKKIYGYAKIELLNHKKNDFKYWLNITRKCK